MVERRIEHYIDTLGVCSLNKLLKFAHGLRAPAGSVVGGRCPAGIKRLRHEGHRVKKVFDRVRTSDIVGLMCVGIGLSSLDARGMNGHKPHGIKAKRLEIREAEERATARGRATHKFGKVAAL